MNVIYHVYCSHDPKKGDGGLEHGCPGWTFPFFGHIVWTCKTFPSSTPAGPLLAVIKTGLNKIEDYKISNHVTLK